MPVVVLEMVMSKGFRSIEGGRSSIWIHLDPFPLKTKLLLFLKAAESELAEKDSRLLVFVLEGRLIVQPIRRS